MASQSRRTSTSVSRSLADEPYRFEFFQAVRLLEQMARERLRAGGGPEYFPVGYDNPPQRETVRFRTLASHSFPPSEVVALKTSNPGDATATAAPVGGNGGVVPGLDGPRWRLAAALYAAAHRPRAAERFSLRDFLDLFNHRAIFRCSTERLGEGAVAGLVRTLEAGIARRIRRSVYAFPVLSGGPGHGGPAGPVGDRRRGVSVFRGIFFPRRTHGPRPWREWFRSTSISRLKCCNSRDVGCT